MHRIEKLILKGYHRLSNSSLNYFEYTPNEKVQFIIGTNGSGKSSVLTELSTNPADKNDYDKDGFKKIIINDNGKKYILTSTFSPKVNHSFFDVDANEELNPGGTGRVQKEIAARLFGVTGNVHDLLLGVRSDLRFSTMSVSARREWFTKMSNVDYTYAIAYYNTLKEKHRDVLGASKHISNIVANLTSKLLDPKEYQQVCETIEHYTKIRRALIDLKPSALTAEITPYAIYEIVEDIKAKSRDIKTYERNADRFAYQLGHIDIIEFKDQADYYSREIAVLKNTIERTENEIAKLANRMDSTIIANSAERESRLVRIKELTENVELLKSKISVDYHLTDDCMNVINAVNGANEYLISTISNLPVNLIDGKMRFTQDEVASLNAQIFALEQSIKEDNRLQSQASSLVKHFEHMLVDNKVSCPVCEHEWSHGYDKVKHDEAIANVEKYANAIVSNENTLKFVKQKRDDMMVYLSEVKSIGLFFRNTPSLSGLYQLVKEIIYTEPKKIAGIVNRYMSDLNTRLQIDAKTDIINTIEKQISDSVSVTEDEYIAMNHALEFKKDALHERITLRNKLTMERGRLQGYINLREMLYKRAIDLDKTVAMLERHESEITDSLLRDVTNDLIHICESKINELNGIKYSSDSVGDNIERNKKELTELLVKESVYKKAIKALNPTDGLIAKGMVGFVNCYVSEMNSFIKKIWTYPLEVVGCNTALENGDLDYRFPIRSDGRNRLDVSEGSSAMREIVDLAFRVVAYKYLGIKDHPLYLDEFGNFFDHKHKRTALNAIANVMAHSDFSQVFIITHDADAYGSVANSGITVLCDKNILLPVGVAYNTNLITLERDDV